MIEQKLGFLVGLEDERTKNIHFLLKCSCGNIAFWSYSYSEIQKVYSFYQFCRHPRKRTLAVEVIFEMFKYRSVFCIWDPYYYYVVNCPFVE